jgi:hypothetical protein
MDKKYVMFSQGVPVLFPASIPHASMANINQGKITSAGFYNVASDGRVEVYGMSKTLQLDHDPTDAFIIQLLLCEKDS